MNNRPPEMDLVELQLQRESVRKLPILEKLFEVSRNDSTVACFFDAWKRGHFPSLEIMLCELAVQLANEKASYLKQATEQSFLHPWPEVNLKTDD